MGREAGDATSQNRWTEACEKEIKIRQQWKTKYGKAYAKDDSGEIVSKKRQASHFTTEQTIPKAASPTQKTEPKTIMEPILDDSQLPRFEMYPATPITKGKLFDGFSKEGKGRALYLECRKSTGPEAKFPYPITEAQEVGWRQEERGTFGKPKHGRSQTIRTFYRDNGVFYEEGTILAR